MHAISRPCAEILKCLALLLYAVKVAVLGFAVNMVGLFFFHDSHAHGGHGHGGHGHGIGRGGIGHGGFGHGGASPGVGAVAGPGR